MDPLPNQSKYLASSLPRWKAALLMFPCGLAIGQALVLIISSIPESHPQAGDEQRAQGVMWMLVLVSGICNAVSAYSPNVSSSLEIGSAGPGQPSSIWVSGLKAFAPIAGMFALALLFEHNGQPYPWTRIAEAGTLMYAGIIGTTYVTHGLKSANDLQVKLKVQTGSIVNSVREPRDSGRLLVFRLSHCMRVLALILGLFLIVFMGGDGIFLAWATTGHSIIKPGARVFTDVIAALCLYPVYLSIGLIGKTYGNRLEVDTITRTYRQFSMDTMGWKRGPTTEFGVRLGRPKLLAGSLDADLEGGGIISMRRRYTTSYAVTAAWRDNDHPASFLSQNYFDKREATAVMNDLAARLGVAALGDLALKP